MPVDAPVIHTTFPRRSPSIRERWPSATSGTFLSPAVTQLAAEFVRKHESQVGIRFDYACDEKHQNDRGKEKKHGAQFHREFWDV